jgi:pimeloyl-ACP methyl ester carboxylesterase
MTESIELHAIHPENHEAKRATSMDIVFIHGLDGDHDGTWRSASGLWPQWVADDHPHAQVWSLGYPAKIGHLLQLGESRQLNAEELAHALADRMRNKSPSIGSRPCIFVCHSLGGLLAKRILINAVSSTDIDRFRHENVAAVMFLGTPHRGSGVSNVLQIAEKAKDVALKYLLPLFGVDLSSISDNVLTTTKLISDLEQNNVPLQHLNERFQHYYAERNRQDVLRIRVFAETLPMKLGPVKTAIVVNKESANPNLMLGVAHAAIDITLVPQADHSSLVKPTARNSEVCEGLNKLIELVSDETGVFQYGDSLHNEVARMIFLAAKRRPKLLTLDRLSNWVSGGNDVARARAFSESLAKLEGESLLNGISQLGSALTELSKAVRCERADVETLQQVVGALILRAAILPANGARAGAEADMEFDTAEIEGVTAKEAADFLEMMIEVSHASLRKWHTQWRVSDDGATVSGGSLIFKSASQNHPSSWHDGDHVNHLVRRINHLQPELRPNTRATLRDGQIDPNLVETPSTEDARDPGLVGRTKATRLLKIRLIQQVGLVVSAEQANSAYQKPALRAKVRELFGNLVAFALPSPVAENNDELAVRITDLQTTIHQFNLQAQEAHSRVKPHAQ